MKSYIYPTGDKHNFYWNIYNRPGGVEQIHHVGILWGFIQVGFLHKKLDFIDIGPFQIRVK